MVYLKMKSSCQMGVFKSKRRMIKRCLMVNKAHFTKTQNFLRKGKSKNNNYYTFCADATKFILNLLEHRQIKLMDILRGKRETLKISTMVSL